VGNYLSFDCHNPHYPDSSITVRELLTHTSSINDSWNLLLSLYVFGEDSPIPLADFMFDYFDPSGIYYSSAQNFFNIIPGTQYNYSNEGAALAAYLVESTSGVSFAEYCNQNIFSPLCMDNTSWFISQLDTMNVAMPYHYSGQFGYVPVGYYSYPDYPDGQLRTSVMSLAKFLAMMMNHGKLNNVQILDSATVAEIFSQQIPSIDTTQGIIWYQVNIDGRICWGHNGGDAGVSTNMYFSPVDSTGIITLSNGSNFYPIDVAEAMFNYAEALEPAPNDSFGCGIPLTVINHDTQNGELKIFPNPASSLITLQGLNEGEKEITISDVTGKLLLRKELSNENSVDVSDLAPGIYFLNSKQSGRGSEMKFVKQ